MINRYFGNFGFNNYQQEEPRPVQEVPGACRCRERRHFRRTSGVVQILQHGPSREERARALRQLTIPRKIGCLA